MRLPEPQPPESWSEEMRETFRIIGQGMADVAPLSWEVLRWRMTYVAGRSRNGLYTVAADGTATIVDIPGIGGPSDEAEEALLGLRATLYRPGAGTWFTAVVTLTAQGGFDLDLNYDDEPQWAFGPPAPAHYASDFARYPRDIEHTPLWLATYLAQAAEDAQQDRDPS